MVSESVDTPAVSRRSKRLVRILAAITAVAFLFGIAAFLYNRPDPVRAEAEQYRVFSDYLSTGLAGFSHDLGTRNGITVILGRTTVTAMLVNKNWFNEYSALIGTLSLARDTLPLMSEWPMVNLLVTNLRSEQLREQFTLPGRYVFATQAETALYGTRAFEERFPGNYGYLTFTRVGFDRKLTEAVFYTEHVCGLCGEGKYVYMRKLHGKWVIQAVAGTWIS